MSTIAATPQDQPRPSPRAPSPSSDGSPSSPGARAGHGGGSLPCRPAVAAVGAGGRGRPGRVGRQPQPALAERETALRAVVAAADAAHAVTGSAGSGWVLETDGQAIFLADALAALPADRIYELWLIGPDGDPVAVGTLARYRWRGARGARA